MREYGKVSPQFWIGKTGKALRGNPEAQIVALYLMTCPNSEMTGIFYCPLLYIAQETGLGLEGASKGLQRLIEAGFCTFEADSDTVFVHEMAKFQIGDELKPNDNRVIGVQKIYANMPESLIRQGFYERYKDIFYLQKEPKKTKPLPSPSEDPTKPRAGTGTGTEVKPLPGDPGYTQGFLRFWEAWPKSQRKEAKNECFKKWKAKGLENLTEDIVNHVLQAKDSKKWRDGYEPAPLTYLNQHRWTDDVPAEQSLPVWET